MNLVKNLNKYKKLIIKHTGCDDSDVYDFEEFTSEPYSIQNNSLMINNEILPIEKEFKGEKLSIINVNDNNESVYFLVENSNKL